MKTEQAKFAVLGGAGQAALDPNAFYLLDLDKIQTVDDVKRILAAIGFNFVGNHPRIALVADLLDRDNAIYPPKEEIKFPEINDEGELETEEYGPGL
jgi:hypothetical protein